MGLERAKPLKLGNNVLFRCRRRMLGRLMDTPGCDISIATIDPVLFTSTRFGFNLPIAFVEQPWP